MGPHPFPTIVRDFQSVISKEAREQILEKDVLLHYPYQSIRPFLRMLSEAANDPQVVSIRMTLYRLARDSKVVEALVEAAENGKQVDVLGRFPLPVEVIPMARSLVAREILRLTGGQPVWRDGTVTDNGNVILDIHNLSIVDPVGIERELNQIPGVVSVGLFARRPADVVIVGGEPPIVL